MPVIDADTHIDETEDTWASIEDGVAYKPYTAYPSKQDPSRQPTTYWMIDGKRQLRRYRDDKRTGTTVETRELLDVQARLRAMDQLGFDVQVIYPTLFLTESTQTPEVELGLRRSYNRWLAKRSDESHGRLRSRREQTRARYPNRRWRRFGTIIHAPFTGSSRRG